MKRKRKTIVVSQKALLRRVNRWLKKERRQQMFKVQRPGGIRTTREAELGRYFIVQNEEIVLRKVDIEDFAREHGVLSTFEAVES